MIRLTAVFSYTHLLLLSAGMGTAISCTQSSRDHMRLQLTEISALRLSPTFTPLGASIGAGGAILYWNGDGLVVTAGHAGDVVSDCVPRLTHIVAGAFVSADSILELIDASGPSLLRLGPSRTCNRQPIGDPGDQVIAAF